LVSSALRSTNLRQQKKQQLISRPPSHKFDIFNQINNFIQLQKKMLFKVASLALSAISSANAAAATATAASTKQTNETVSLSSFSFNF